MAKNGTFILGIRLNEMASRTIIISGTDLHFQEICYLIPNWLKSTKLDSFEWTNLSTGLNRLCIEYSLNEWLRYWIFEI